MAEDRGPWSVKGIDDRARQAARNAARERGMTLGEYLNELLTEGGRASPDRESAAQERPQRQQPDSRDTAPPPRPRAKPVAESDAPRTLEPADALRALARRIEAIEAKSTLAITGIDQSVIGLVRRLENAEHGQDAVVSHVDTMMDDLRSTHEQLQAKIRQIETDDTPKKSLESLKSLEDALGKLAAHVYEEGAMTQAENEAIKGRVEAGFADVNDRVEAMEVKVEQTLSSAAKRVEKAVEQAELRTEGSSRHLSDRFSSLEEKVAARLERVEHVNSRVDHVQADVSGALTSMESLLTRIQERLNKAESTTDAAMKGLETTFDTLDRRIEEVAQQAGPQMADQIRDQFEQRFEGLAAALSAKVDKARQDMAAEIERAAQAMDPERIGKLEASLAHMGKRIEQSELRQSRTLDAVSDEFRRFSSVLDKRMRDVEARDADAFAETAREEIGRLASEVNERLDSIDAREASAIDEVGKQVGELADRLEQRVSESEHRSAKAIEQVGEQVAGVVHRLKARQDEAIKAVTEKLDETTRRSEARLSDALERMSERLEAVSRDTRETVSPVQRAMASLVARIEMLEDFTSPPGVPEGLIEPPGGKVDLKPPPGFEPPKQKDRAKAAPPPVTHVRPDHDDADDFEDGWDLEEEEVGATRRDMAPEPSFESTLEGFETDPLAALEESEDEEDDPHGADEVRDNDIFGDEADEPPPARLRDDQDDAVPPRDAPRFADELLPDDPESESDFPPVSRAERDADTDDYLARARRAAIAAAAASSNGAPRRRPASGGGSRTPLIATAAALAIAATGGAAWYMTRDKYPRGGSAAGPTQEPVDYAQLPVPPAGDAGIVSTPEESDLFTEEETPVAAGSEAAEDIFEPEAETVETLPPARAEPPKSGLSLAEAAPLPTPKPKAEPAPAPTPTVVASVSPKPQPRPTPVASTPVVPPQAAVTLDSAARSGNPIAQLTLGEQRLAAGSIGEGVGLIEQAARQGLPAAQYRLAKLYEKGTGLPRDLTQARAWIEKAAEGGNVMAMHDLAVFYAEGDAGTQSYSVAATWFRRAAEYGLVDSQFNLALLYDQGLGVSPDVGEALFWFEVASRNGDGMATDRVRTLRQRVSLEAAQTAQRRAASFTPSEPDAEANGRFGTQPWDRAAGGGAPAATSLKDAQRLLAQLGYDPGGVDGKMGSRTRSAIMQFQRDRGLPVNGEFDAVLMIALRNAVDNLTAVAG